MHLICIPQLCAVNTIFLANTKSFVNIHLQARNAAILLQQEDQRKLPERLST